MTVGLYRYDLVVYLDGRRCMTIPKFTRWGAQHEVRRVEAASGVGASALFHGDVIPVYTFEGKPSALVVRHGEPSPEAYP